MYPLMTHTNQKTMTASSTVAVSLLAVWSLSASSVAQIASSHAPRAYAISAELRAPDPLEAPGGQKSSGKKDDPAYRLYKQGYDLILDERWEEAGKKLAE